MKYDLKLKKWIFIARNFNQKRKVRTVFMKKILNTQTFFKNSMIGIRDIRRVFPAAFHYYFKIISQRFLRYKGTCNFWFRFFK